MFLIPNTASERRVSSYRGVWCIWLLLSLIMAFSAQGQQQKRELKNLQQEIKVSEKLLTQQKKQLDELQAELKRDELQMSNLAAKVHQTTLSMGRKESEKSQQIIKQKALKQKINQQKDALEKAMRIVHSSGSNESFKVLFSQTSSPEVQRNLEYFKYLTAARTNKIVSFRQDINDLAKITKALNNNILDLKALSDSLTTERQEVSTQQAKRKKVVKKMNALVRTEQQKLNQLKLNEQRLQDKLREIERASVIANIELTGLAKLKKKLSPPVKGRIRKLFGIKREGQLRWNGIKIEGKHGIAVSTIHQGQVLFADWLKGFGLVMVVDHGEGYMSIYGHNQALLKQAGDNVLAGETIALLGSSGGQKRSALYFEIRHKGVAVNPTLWFK